MLLKRITLENFGLFRGRNEVDLTPRVRSRGRRPVILIGGKNGAGKTTLLDALRLSLYGPLALGNRISAREYESHLADRIHRSSDPQLQPTGAAVAVEFDYAQAGEVATYVVERRWERHEKGVRYNLTVNRNGQPLDELDREHADAFLRDLIPPGVSQLFFFDGEKIQQLADSEQDHVALADAVRALIGLDHVERLGSDLRLYAGRLNDLPAADPLKTQHAALGTEKESLTARRPEAVRELDQAEANRDRVRLEVNREEQELTRVGGAFATRRESLVAERNQLDQTVKEIRAEIEPLCDGLLPFVFASHLCGALKSQLASERDILKWRSYENTLLGRLDQIKAGIDGALFPLGQNGISAPLRVVLRSRVEQILDGLVTAPHNLPSVQVVHRLSNEERDQLAHLITRVQGELPGQVISIQNRLERTTRRLQEVEESLGRIPEEDAIQPTFERLQELHRELGSAQAVCDRTASALKEIDHRMEEVNRQLVRLEEKLAHLNKVEDRGALVGRVQGALESFARALTEAKVTELRDAVVRSFSRLWRKGDVVRRIDFDPSDLRVTLFDQHDRPLPKQSLSAGEKQIYAIALLWALAQVSGRPLPVLIDTPLGRLDHDHRSNLVTRYFPHASHQIVILSTDTEIDQNFFWELAPVVSHSYHLRYDEVEARCVIEEGYFWAQQGKEVAGATD